MSELKKLQQDFCRISLNHAFSQPGCLAVLNFRFAAAAYQSRLKLPLYFFYLPLWRIVSSATGIEISPRTKIGAGLKIIHYGQIFIHPNAVLGQNVRIANGVTIGVKNIDSVEAPTIGNNVDIGAGAKILGAINVGSNCVIGANAVVTKSFPSGHVIAGVPARSIREGVPTSVQ